MLLPELAVLAATLEKGSAPATGRRASHLRAREIVWQGGCGASPEARKVAAAPRAEGSQGSRHSTVAEIVASTCSEGLIWVGTESAISQCFQGVAIQCNRRIGIKSVARARRAKRGRGDLYPAAAGAHGLADSKTRRILAQFSKGWRTSRVCAFTHCAFAEAKRPLDSE
jgi:hypothetical protein